MSNQYLLYNPNTGKHSLSAIIPNSFEFDRYSEKALTNGQDTFQVVNHEVGSKCLVVCIEGIEVQQNDYTDIDTTHIKLNSDIASSVLKDNVISSKLIGYTTQGSGSSVDIDDANASTSKVYSSSYVKNQLDLIQNAIDDLNYKTPNVSLTNNIGIVEKGSTVNNVTLNWTINKTVTSQSITDIGSISDVSLRTYNLTGLGLTSNKSWTITVNDGKNNATASTSVQFSNGKYYGVSSSTTYDNSLITSLTKELVENKSKTFTVTANNGQYIYYAIPSRLGSCSFSVGGFSGGFDNVATINYTNSSGYSENYDIYKSTNANLGNTTVVVS